MLSSDCGIAEREVEETWFWKAKDQYASYMCEEQSLFRTYMLCL